MANEGQPVERLREYLRTLTPKARTMLVHELERNMLHGDESAGNDLILQELRRTIRADNQPTPRIGDTARLFFTPLEPFLIDVAADHKRIGRIARVSLEPIWAWIARDLIPAEAKALGEDIDRARNARDQAKADQLVRALQDRAMQRMKDTVAAVASDEKARRRLGVHVGTPRAVEDLGTLIAIFSLRDTLADIARRLPNQIRVFDAGQVESIKSLLDTAVAQCSFDSRGSAKSDILLYGLILVLGRLAAPWQLIRIAIRAADSDDTARIAATPYAGAVGIVLGDTEAMVREVRTELKFGRPIASMLKAIHDAARGLRTEMELSVELAVEPPIGGDPRRYFEHAESRNRDHAGLHTATVAAASGERNRAGLGARFRRRQRRREPSRIRRCVPALRQ